MIVRYEIDGKLITAMPISAERPQVYAVRVSDGPICGYVLHSLLGRSEAYVGSAMPNTVDARLVGTFLGMRKAMERIVREEPADVAGENAEVLS